MSPNVLIISHMYPRAANPVKGIFVHEQVKELIKLGCSVKVISAVPWAPFPLNRLSSRWRSYARTPVQEQWEGIDVFYPRYLCFPGSVCFEYSGFFLYWAIGRLISRIRKSFDFDLIHAHVAMPDGFAASLIKAKYRRPLVVTIHGKDLYFSVHKGKRIRDAVERVFERADKVILVSNPLKSIAEAEFGSTGKTVVIGNGVPWSSILPPEEATAGENHNIVVSASYLIPRKGLNYNLEAVARLADKHPSLLYLIIGDGEEQQRLHELTASLGIQKHVRFLGRLSHRETLEQMAGAHIFSLPSWDEAFGVVYVEAMAHGKPVIGCRGEGIEDFVEHGKTGLLVQPKDVEELAEAMDYLLSNPHQARSMGTRAREVVMNAYTWEQNARRNLALYEELLRES